MSVSLSVDPLTAAALDEGWIRAVLFEGAIDDWVDLGPDPIRRRHVGQIYADQVGAAYAAWKWRCDRAGTDIDLPPAPRAADPALAAEIAVADWTGLMAALFTVGRAQAALFADLAASGDDAARRAFDRVGRDLAGHAALAFLELRRSAAGGGATFVDADRARAAVAALVPAARALLAPTGLERSWTARIDPLLADLGWV